MESLRIKDVRLVKLLEKAKGLCEGPRLFNGSWQDFRNDFHSLLKALGLFGLGFQPYSLRRGGATHFFTKTSSLDATVVRGRWKDGKTARIYLDDAVAWQVQWQLPEEVQNVISELADFWTDW